MMMSPRETSSLSQQMFRNRREGFHYISQALDCEERAAGSRPSTQLVVALYRLGVDELTRAIDLCGELGSGSCPDSQRLRREMEVGRSNARERMIVLGGGSRRDRVGPTGVEAAANAKSSRREAASSPVQRLRDRFESLGAKGWEASLRSSTPPPSSTRGPAKAKTSPSKVVRMGRSQEERGGAQVEQHAEEQGGLESYLRSSIVASGTNVGFGNVIGLEKAKQSLRESVILPAMRPEIFSGLRSPAQGLLLFGPPGNGKTFLVKALATETKATLFNITAAVLTSKFFGEGEKMMKKLFEMAKKKSPAIIFIDEIDSILSSRSSNEHEASRRMKTEFFASFDGLQSQSTDRILVVGATNRPEEIDSAAIRRFTKRIYIPMPDFDTRKMLLTKLLSEHDNPLSPTELGQIAKATSGYSASDLSNLARDAAFGPIREIPADRLVSIRADDIRRIDLSDFRSSVARVRTSVAGEDVGRFEEWNAKYGDVSL